MTGLLPCRRAGRSPEGEKATCHIYDAYRRLTPSTSASRLPGFPASRVVIVASPESVTVLAGFLGAGGHPPLHTHDVDLFFVVLEGSTTIRLGHDSRQVQVGEVIYIPAGLPHGSDSQSGADELHLEILIPAVRPGTPFLTPVRNVDDVRLPAAPPHVTSSSGPPKEVTGHETRWVLTGDSTGARTARVTAVERTGSEHPATSASRDDDRLVVVTQGELAAEIAGRGSGRQHREHSGRNAQRAPVCAHESPGIRGRWLSLTADPPLGSVKHELAPGDP